MKTNARMILVISASLLLTACAATEPRPVGQGFSHHGGYMKAVEREAWNKGVDVIWINAPDPRPAVMDETNGG